MSYTMQDEAMIRAIELSQVVDEVVEEGHMHTHHLARLRAASERFDEALAQPAQAPAQPAPQPSASDEIERVERLMARAEAHDAAQEWRSKPSAVEALARGETNEH